MFITEDEKVFLIKGKGQEILGYSENDILGRNWFDTYLPSRAREKARAVFRPRIFYEKNRRSAADQPKNGRFAPYADKDEACDRAYGRAASTGGPVGTGRADSMNRALSGVGRWVVAALLSSSVLPALAQSPLEIESALAKSAVPDEVVQFYEKRDHRPAWFENGVARASYLQLENVVAGLNEHGIEATAYDLPERTMAGADAEIRASIVALRLGRELLKGRLDPRRVYTGWSLSSRDRALSELLSAAVDASDVAGMYESLEPAYEEYRQLKKALRDYRRIEAAGGWPEIAAGGVIHPGDTNSVVPEFRRRLTLTEGGAGGMPNVGDVFDETLERSVRSFQARHGLEVDGIVGPRTFAALNVPVGRRIRQLELNMERWRWMPERWESTFVEINIPAYSMRLVSGGQVVMQMKAIVGTPRTRTPVFSTRISAVILAPYWYVPRSIEVNEILPRLARDPGYLIRNDMRRVAGGTLRQDPGPRNPLGRVKFEIPNPHGVGLHDTPERQLFDRAVCAFSHGCIRLQDPEELAKYLLADKGWSRERLRDTIEQWRETRIAVGQPVALHVLYWTAWMNAEGRVHFRDDIYGYDDRMDQALLGDR